jgi:hypothetical protein
MTAWSLRPLICGSGDVLTLFSLPWNPFPGNGDRSRQKLGSNGQLLRRKPEHLVLTGPFGSQVREADYSHAMRKPSFNRSLDEARGRRARLSY